MIQQQYASLNGEWTLKDGNGLECPVDIPGSVLSAAVQHGILEDPYYRMNEYPTREFLRQDFEFCRTFSLEKRQGYVYELCCDGIDTVADIFINGILVKQVDNMHQRYRILCTGALKNGENTLRVHIHSAIRYIEEYVPQPGKEIHYTACGAMEGNQYIRKAHSMFGWDWGPQLPDMGIWRDIFIEGTAVARIAELKIHQKHTGGQVELSVEPFLSVRADIMREAEQDTGSMALNGLPFAEAQTCIPSLELVLTLHTPDGEKIPFSNGRCMVAQPQLWWPNGYGKQPLYTVHAALWADGVVLHEKQYRIGLRTLAVSQEKDDWGEEFAFCVNGIKIFAKGADYIPEDCIYQRITPGRIRFLLDTAADCGFNCIRVWGGGYYPSDVFYDYCDEKGLLVWQDFMFACNVYGLTDKWRQTITDEVTDNVRRLRHHASLALWCGNNEMESAWNSWAGFCDHPQPLRQDYLEIFEEIIPKAVRSEDDVTFYWPSSPSSGGGFQNPDSDHAGDRHYWDVWHGEKPFSDYENYYFRFCSEFGFQSFPCRKTVESFTLPSDRNIFTEVMESHQKNGAANGKIMRYISDNFLYPKDFRSLLYISQVLQGIAVKEGVEHWRRNRGRCMGAIYWQLNDNWPVASWASVDYYGRWKALQYMARHFYADLLGTLRIIEGESCQLTVQNETLQPSQTNVQLFVKDMSGAVLYKSSGQIDCAALSVASIDRKGFGAIIKGRENAVFIEAVFLHSNGTVSRQVHMPKPYKHMMLKKASITCSCEREGDLLALVLKSDVPAFFVEIETDVDMVLSDNFMHLTGQEEYRVTGKLPEGYAGIPKVKVWSLRDSYE